MCSNSSSKLIGPWAIHTCLVTTGMTSTAFHFRTGPVGLRWVTFRCHEENLPFSSPLSISSADSSASIIAGCAAAPTDPVRFPPPPPVPLPVSSPLRPFDSSCPDKLLFLVLTESGSAGPV